MLQRVRDESHRFAITFHRERRGKSMLESILDTVDGLGPAKQKALRAEFSSLKKMRAATVEELQGTKGIGPALAQKIYDALHSEDGEAR